MIRLWTINSCRCSCGKCFFCSFTATVGPLTRTSPPDGPNLTHGPVTSWQINMSGKFLTHLMLALVLVLSQGLVGHEPVPYPATPVPACNDPSESYYEEAQPYGEPFNGKNRNSSQRQTIQLLLMTERNWTSLQVSEKWFLAGCSPLAWLCLMHNFCKVF